jgi:chromosome segregation ATPase
MTDSLTELLEELTPEEFKEFTDRVDAARQKRGVTNFTQGESMSNYQEGVKEYLAAIAARKKPVEQFISQAEAETTAAGLQAEQTRLMKNPSKNMKRLQQIQTELSELNGKVNHRDQAQAAALKATHAEEMQNLQSDLQTLTAQHSTYLKNPTRYASEIASIQGEMAKREQRINEIENSTNPSLKWQG